jgi:hypothetical protein
MELDAKKRLIDLLTRHVVVEIDSNNGEVIIRTGIFQWADLAWRDGADSSLHDNSISDE